MKMASYLLLWFLSSLSFCGLSSVSGTQELNWAKCEPTDYVCDYVECPTIKDCDGDHQDIVPKGSYCGCCDSCVQLLDQNHNCINEDEAPYKEPSRHCKAGLICDLTKRTCQELDEKDLPVCLRIIKMRQAIVNRFVPIISVGEVNLTMPILLREDIWMPKCDKKGMFERKQCKEKKCICLYENGVRLFGSAEKELATNMTCDCSVVVHKDRLDNPAAWRTKPHLRCNMTGDFMELQCYEGLCFCADEHTGKPKGNIVHLEHQHFLPCYRQKSSLLEEYLTRCEKQEMVESKLNYEFHQKGITIPESFKTVLCDIDGAFAGRQCTSQSCYCSDRNGTSMKSYQIDRATTDETKMYCRCARDEYDRERNGARYPVLKCGAKGQFEYHQCHGKDCFCVDEDGDYLTQSFEFFDHVNEFCQGVSKFFTLEDMLLKVGIFDPSRLNMYQKGPGTNDDDPSLEEFLFSSM